MVIKTAPRWATANKDKADQMSTPAAPAEVEHPSKRAHRMEHDRRIRDRRRSRRAPGYAATGVAAWSTLAWGVVEAFETVGVDALSVAGVMASAPAIAAAVTAVKHRAWAPDLLAGGMAAGGLTVWTGVAGPSWLGALALVGGALGCGYRWLKAHPLGPGVAPLMPAWELPPVPEPAPRPERPPVDEYVVAWEQFNAGSKGKVPGSKLTGRDQDEHTITYDVELRRGEQNISTLQVNAVDLAGGLGIDREQIIFEKGPRGAGEHRARLTIVTNDPVADVRYYAGPRVENGVIKGLARYKDGRGEADVTMWTRAGMVPTMIVGSTGGGKSAAANMVTCGAMSTGALNLLYIDPKGNSSTALRNRARVAIIGRSAALRAPELVQALVDARSAYAAVSGQDLLRATASFPGWMVLHDEFSLITGDAKVMREWCQISNIVRSLAFWLVALNQALQESKWGDDQTRSAFASQVIAFRINSKSSSDLVPGLEYKPADLPCDDEGNPVPGMAVHANTGRSNVPCRWDWLPAASDEVDEEPPYRTSSAFDTFFRQPDLDEVDRLAIESVLGPAVDGRWVVGPGGTHEFAVDELGKSVASAPRPAAAHTAPNGFGLPPVEDITLTDAQQRVLDVVNAGACRTGDIEAAAAPLDRSTVGKALPVLAGHGLIRRGKRGMWYRLENPPAVEDLD